MTTQPGLDPNATDLDHPEADERAAGQLAGVLVVGPGAAIALPRSRPTDPANGHSPAEQHNPAHKRSAVYGVATRFGCKPSSWMGSMPRVRGRQVRSGVADAQPLQVRVSPANRQKAAEIADALGISMAAYVDALLSREERDENGRPTWWTDPVPADQRELPLKSA